MKKRYCPQPKDTSKIVLPAELREISELLAENTHEVWAMQRITEGWQYGAERNDKQKEHPCLVPYMDLSECEKDYDRNTAMETVRLILSLGYEIYPRKPIKQGCYFPDKNSFVLVFDEGRGNIVLPDGNLKILWASNKTLPEKALFEPLADSSFLLLDADVLRKAGAMISIRVSWERTATELLWQIQNNTVLSHIRDTPEVLITFAEDGAIYIKRENSKLSSRLILVHGDSEGVLRTKSHLSPDECFEKMTVAFALQLQRKIPFSFLSVLEAATDMDNGFSLKAMEAGELKIVDSRISAGQNEFEIPFASGQSVIDPDFWCITNSVSNRRIFDLACEYVRYGRETIKGLPQLTFGKLTTIDRREIEAYQDVSNLIVKYACSDSVQPLSIAVFGAPGSGKSFGVKQIAKNVLNKIEILEFNVSQFTGNSNLISAFHKVRDSALEGKLPLVFFDEFDSDSLAWLKSFLMPMQDGKFTDENGEHPIGKSIFIFAGGTAAAFEDFINPPNEDDYKKAKAPDFVSRLKGFMNVLGPNCADENDKNYLLRRAILLRSFCERNLKPVDGKMPISKDVLWAMLQTPKYKNGARSMEAIHAMSRIENNEWTAASLPPVSQLSLYVDADAFNKLVLREIILNSYTEKLAIAIHDDYRRKNPGTNEDKPWEELTEHIKETNRNQARNYGKYLNTAGYDFDAGDSQFVSIKKFNEEEIEMMAKHSHEVWMKNKIKDGWVYGLERDSVKKTNPCLVEWDKLPENEKRKDRDIAVNIIPMMERIGFRVYKVI